MFSTFHKAQLSGFLLNLPYHRPPSSSKAENEEARKDNHGDGRMWCVLRDVPIECKVADRREDHEADEHPSRACHERFPTAVMLYDVEAVEGDAEVDAILGRLVYWTSPGCESYLPGSFG